MRREWIKNLKRAAVIAAWAAVSVLGASGVAAAEEATELDIKITNSNGKETGILEDEKYSTRVAYAAGDTIKITSESEIGAVSVVWGDEPAEWTLTTDTGGDIKCGGKGFLHEYVPLAVSAKECVINIPKDMTVCDVKAYSKGDPAASVQLWNDPCETADILVFAAHADDEILYMGGVLAAYGGQEGLKVQVVYLSQYWEGPQANPIREHEKLDGLWTSGIKNYPVCLGIEDVNVRDLEAAKQETDYDKLVSEIRSNINRFKPQVVITHDEKGEYGHGQHMMLAEAVKAAVDSPAQGDWDVPKTYLHLYGENKITLNLKQQLSAFGGKTALEVAQEAYVKHKSQRKTAFYVSDDYEYSCAEFGLYRSTVGQDTGSDIMENTTVRKTQAEETGPEPTPGGASEPAGKGVATAAAATRDLPEKKDGSKIKSVLGKILLALIIVSALACGSYFVHVYRTKKEEERRREAAKKSRSEGSGRTERRRTPQGYAGPERRRTSGYRVPERRQGTWGHSGPERRQASRGETGSESRYAGGMGTAERRRSEGERIPERRRAEGAGTPERRRAQGAGTTDRRPADRTGSSGRRPGAGGYRGPERRTGRGGYNGPERRTQYNFVMDNRSGNGSSGNGSSDGRDR